jgi:hypothetical protein
MFEFSTAFTIKGRWWLSGDPKAKEAVLPGEISYTPTRVLTAVFLFKPSMYGPKMTKVIPWNFLCSLKIQAIALTPIFPALTCSYFIKNSRQPCQLFSSIG